MHFVLRDVLGTAGRPQKAKRWRIEELVRSWDPRTFADRHDRMPVEDQGIAIENIGILVSLAGFVWLYYLLPVAIHGLHRGVLVHLLCYSKEVGTAPAVA